MKVYMIWSDCVEYVEYVKADSPGKAKAQSEHMIFDLDYVDIRARRIPALDNAERFTDRALWDAGLTVCCWECGGPIEPGCGEPGEEEIRFLGEASYHPRCADRVRAAINRMAERID